MVNKENYIQRLKVKDIKALDYVVDNYSSLIFKVAYSVLNNRHLSEECVNDVLFKIWNSIVGYKSDEEKFGKWVVVLAKYTAIDILRKEVRHGKSTELNEYIVDTKENIQENYEIKETIGIIKCEIENLSNDSKEILKKRYLEGQEISEIAEEMGKSNDFISNKLSRGKKKLRQVLKGRV